MKPRVGLRLRRTVQRKQFSIGMLSTIDVVHKDRRDFWVATDEGGFCGWTNFEQWAPIPETTTTP